MVETSLEARPGRTAILRLIGSIRRECTDHLIVLNEEHLRQILAKFAAYYNGWRPHVSIAKDAPSASGILSHMQSWADCITGTHESSFWKRQAKIDAAAHEIENVPAEQNPATAHLFIINPLSGARMDNLFSTHPSTENRIAALEQLAAQMGVTRSGRRSGLAHSASGPWG